MSIRHLALVTAILVGCSSTSPVEVDDEPPPSIDSNFERLPTVLKGIDKTADVVLYEGLPDIFWQPALREGELKTQKTVKLHGYPFYEGLLPLQQADSAELTGLLSSPKTFNRYGGLKPCGGYHPDYCVEWRTAAGITHVLISLECGEVKLYGLQCELHCDLTTGTAEKLKQLLSEYRQNRPNKD